MAAFSSSSFQLHEKKFQQRHAVLPPRSETESQGSGTSMNQLKSRLLFRQWNINLTGFRKHRTTLVLT